MIAFLIGYTAAFCTTVALVPQVYRAWTTRSTTDVSLGWISLLSFGSFLWLVHGLTVADGPLIAANGLTCALACAILVMKLRFG